MKQFRWLGLVIVAVLCISSVADVQGASLDTVFVSSVEADSGVTGVHVPVYARVGAVAGEDLDGVNFGFSYDQSVLVCDTIIYEVTDSSYSSFYDLIPSPFMFTPRCYVDSGWATTGIIFSMLGDNDISPGYYRMFDLVFDVKSGAVPGYYPLHIDDEAGIPHIGNYFTHNITVEYFDKVDGIFTVLGDMYGAISGTVVNQENSQPIEDAYVRANGYSDQTNQYGEYLISNLPAGTYDVIAIAFGFEPDTVENVEVTVGHTTNVDFELTPSECVNTLFCGDGSGIGGDTIKVPITAMNCSELDGYTVSLAYDPEFLRALDIDTTGTATGGASPDSFHYIVTAGGEVIPGYAVAQCFISSDHSRTIPIGTNRLFNIIFEVKPNAPDTVDFEFETYPEIPPWLGASPGENKFIFGDFWFTPNLENGQFIMLPAFIRGDVNGDAFLGVNDALMIFQWIFKIPGAPSLTCLDAADYDDDGMVLTNDPLNMLLWIFKVDGSVPPKFPFPKCGIDPTLTDFLLCDWHQSCMTDGDGVFFTLDKKTVAGENTLTVGEASLGMEQRASIPITLRTVEEVSGFQFLISFDPKLISVESIENTNLVSSFDFFVPFIDNDNGVVMIGGIPDFRMRKLLPPGTSHLFDVTFVGKEQISEPKAISLVLSDVGIYDSRVGALQIETKSGQIKLMDDPSVLPEDFVLEQNYPNPFNRKTRVSFLVPIGSDAKLEVFDICGRRICTLFEGEHVTTGRIRVFWDGKNETEEEISSGIYFYRLSCGRESIVKKMIFLK